MNLRCSFRYSHLDSDQPLYTKEFLNVAALRIIKEVRAKVYRTMINQEAGWFDTKGTGELVNRLSNDTYIIGNSFSQNLSDGLRSIVTICAGTSMMIYTSPELAMVSMGIVPCIAGLAIVYGRYVRSITRQILDKYAEIMKTGEERLNNIKTVKMFCKEEYENRLFDGQLIDALELGYKDVLARATFYGLVSETNAEYFAWFACQWLIIFSDRIHG